MFRQLGKWWRRRQRAIDKKCLFPSLAEKATSNKQLGYAIFAHVMRDEAWRHVGEWCNEEPQIYRMINNELQE